MSAQKMVRKCCGCGPGQSTGKKIASGRSLGAAKTFRLAWSDESECQPCHKDKGTEKHRLYRMARDQKGDPRGFQKVGAKKREHRRKNGNGKEENLSAHIVEASGTEEISG